MTREEELEKVKQIIQERNLDFYCGLFFTQNIAGDRMEVLFQGRYFRLECCYDWGYFELFNCTEEEKEEVKSIYKEFDEL